MFKKTTVALAFATMLVAACGGSNGSGSSSNPSGTGTTPQAAAVAGPLDTVQSSLTSNVVGPLIVATSGTPLSSVLYCGNSLLTQNALDIADSFANGLASPSTLVATTPAQAQAALTALVSNLSGLLTSLGSASALSTPACSGLAGGTATVPTSNPLAGTPLAALGTALLPVLTSAQQQLAAGAGGTPATLSATQLTSILSMLSTAFNQGLAQVPGSAVGAPIVGGLLLSLQDALNQLTALATLGSTGGSPTATAAAFQAVAQSVLDGLLTSVVPVGALQGAAGSGASTNVVGTLQAAVAALTSGLASNPTTALPANPLSTSGFSPLAGILMQLQTALPTALNGSSGVTALTTALGPIQTLLDSLLSTGTGTGTGSTCPLHFLGLC